MDKKRQVFDATTHCWWSAYVAPNYGSRRFWHRRKWGYMATIEVEFVHVKPHTSKWFPKKREAETWADEWLTSKADELDPPNKEYI